MLIKAGYPQDRISTVPNFIFMNNQSLNNTYGSYAAFIGRIVPEKGVATLLSAAQKTGLPVHFAGDYSTMPNIEKVTMKNVRFLGHISRNHITDFFRNARFSVVPSICYETFGLVVIEAMYHGLPVIASRIGGIPEIIEDGVTGFLVEPGNADELSGRMKLLWDNPNLCKRMGQAGRKMVIREYNEDVFYNRTMALYEKAIQFSSMYHKNSDNKPSYTFHHITGDAQCAE
jgi:glycosyltransferase involved in cell wall biosynthesis